VFQACQQEGRKKREDERRRKEEGGMKMLIETHELMSFILLSIKNCQYSKSTREYISG